MTFCRYRRSFPAVFERHLRRAYCISQAGHLTVLDFGFIHLAKRAGRGQYHTRRLVTWAEGGLCFAAACLSRQCVPHFNVVRRREPSRDRPHGQATTRLSHASSPCTHHAMLLCATCLSEQATRTSPTPCTLPVGTLQCSALKTAPRETHPFRQDPLKLPHSCLPLEQCLSSPLQLRLSLGQLCQHSHLR